MRSITRVRLLVPALIVLALIVLAPLVAPGGALSPASAAPGGSAARAQAELDELNDKASQVVEDYDEAKVKLDEAQRQLKTSQAKLTAQQAKLDQLLDAYGELAAAAYRNGATTNMATILGSDNPTDFISRATTLQAVTAQQQEQLREVKVARNKLAQQQEQIEQQLAATKKLEKQLKGKKQQIDSLVARQERLVSQAQASDRASRAAAAAAAAQRATRSAQRGDDGGGGSAAPVYSGPASGRAAIAVRYAYAQLGKPYRVAGDGPGSFDCSGLTMRAWGAAGVHLPHSSRAQFGYGHKVSRSQLRPGDLVFFGHPIHHVGIYIGGGKFIDAPHPGAVVRIKPLSSYKAYVGAVRL